MLRERSSESVSGSDTSSDCHIGQSPSFPYLVAHEQDLLWQEVMRAVAISHGEALQLHAIVLPEQHLPSLLGLSGTPR